MKFVPFAASLVLFTLILSCKSRDYNQRRVDEEQQPPNAGPAYSRDDPWPSGPPPARQETQVAPKAFDAFLVLRDGQGLNGGAGVFDYPEDYSAATGKIAADGVFYVERKEYWNNDLFVGRPTNGVRVSGDVTSNTTKSGVLTYFPYADRTLTLKFSEPAPTEMNHANAQKYCKREGLRLPTIRELLDFCAMGNLTESGIIGSHRCNNARLISASVSADNRSNVWLFSGYNGELSTNSRTNLYAVRCVGPE